MGDYSWSLYIFAEISIINLDSLHSVSFPCFDPFANKLAKLLASSLIQQSFNNYQGFINPRKETRARAYEY